MSANFIVNQDRDIIIPFDPASLLYITNITIEDIKYGINLMCDNTCLGTFDEPSDAIKEVSSIYNCKTEIYAINGYSVGGFDECLL